ncbi:MAG: hypothetical protein P8X88_05910 [Gammaproteobacteria bacterium]
MATQNPSLDRGLMVLRLLPGLMSMSTDIDSPSLAKGLALQFELMRSLVRQTHSKVKRRLRMKVFFVFEI